MHRASFAILCTVAAVLSPALSLAEEQPIALPPSAAAPSQPVKGAPRIHVDADRPGVRLMRIDALISSPEGEPGMMVRSVCTAPCGQIVDGRRGQTFFFAAPGMVPSPGFRVSRLGGDYAAHVDGGSSTARTVGYLIGAFGGAGVIGGVIMLGVGSAAGGSISSEGRVAPKEESLLLPAGGITLGVGAAMVVTSIALVATNHTRLVLEPATRTSTGVRFEGGKLLF